MFPDPFTPEIQTPTIEVVPSPHAIPLFITEIEAMGGAERAILALGRWLHNQSRPVYLLTYGDRIGLAKHADFLLPSVQLNPGPGTRAKIATLRQHLRSRPADAPPPLTSGYQPALHCALARTGVFHCLMHDTPSLFAERPSLAQRLRFSISNGQIGRVMRRHQGVMIVNSEFLRGECRRDFGLDAHIVRMGGLAGAQTFQRRQLVSLAGQRPRLHMLSVSRIEANKRVDWMLDALHALEHRPTPLSTSIDWSLEIVGKGALLNPMRARTTALGLGSRIRFRGYVDDQELETLYSRAHLFLMPAVQGYGIPAVEALSRGIPVILHRDSGVSDILLDTPWASVLHQGVEEFTTRLEAMLAWLLEGGPQCAPAPPTLPTEKTWAARVSSLCGYL